MTEETKIDKDYLQAFNLGYELAKELNLKSPMFKDLNSDNSRMNAMQAGMSLFNKEISQGNNKEIAQSIGLKSNSDTHANKDSKKGHGKDKGKGFDFFI